MMTGVTDKRKAGPLFELEGVLANTKSCSGLSGTYLIATALYFCWELELPYVEDLDKRSLSTAEWEDYPNRDQEKFFQETIASACNQIETMKHLWDVCIAQHGDTVWWQGDYGNSAQLLQSRFQETVESCPQALLEAIAIFGTLKEEALPTAIMPWFIRYGDQEAITEYDVMVRLAQRLYKEYIIRLPSDELAEFLLSETEHARAMAKNKVLGSLLDDDED